MQAHLYLSMHKGLRHCSIFERTKQGQVAKSAKQDNFPKLYHGIPVPITQVPLSDLITFQ